LTVTVPAVVPESTPVPEIVAVPVPFVTDHTPPVVASDKFIVLPAHTELLPVIGATVGFAFIVTVVVAVFIQPEPFVTV
jgi:hypothetical protein